MSTWSSIGGTQELAVGAEALTRKAEELRTQPFTDQALQAQSTIQQQNIAMNEQTLRAAKFKQAKDEEEYQHNHEWLPVSQLVSNQPKAVQDYLMDYAKSRGAIKNIGGVDSIQRMEAQNLYTDLSGAHDKQLDLDKLSLDHINQQMANIATQLQDPKVKEKDKTILLQKLQGYGADQKVLVNSISDLQSYISSKDMKTDLPTKYTPESIREYERTGNVADLKPRQDVQLEKTTEEAAFTMTKHGPPYSPEEVAAAEKSVGQKKIQEKIQTKQEEDVQKHAAAKERMAPLVDQAVASKTYDPQSFGTLGGDRGDFAAALAEKYPNVSLTKLDKNAKFMGDATLMRARVWGQAAMPRLEALKQIMKEYDPSQYPGINGLRNWIKFQTGDDEVASLLTTANSTLFETLRAIGASGQFSDYRIKLEQNMMNPTMNVNQFQASINNLEQAVQVVMDSTRMLPYDDVRIDPSKNPDEVPAKPTYKKTGSASGATASEDTKTIDGVTYVKRNGQWFPQ